MKKTNKRNKMPTIDRNKFIESVYHIVYYGNIVRNLDNVLLSVADKITSHERMTIRYSIQGNIIINTISLLDELRKYLFIYKPSDKETKEKIDAYKYIIDPILTDIDKWIDIRKFRNNVLAHNFRIDSDDFKSVHLSNKLYSYNIPESTLALATLIRYLDAITKIAEELFKVEYLEAAAIVNKFTNTPKKISHSIEDETKKVNLILSEVNARIKKLQTK